MNKLSKLLNVVIYLCIISYALPTGVMKGIPIQKILVCLLIILGEKARFGGFLGALVQLLPEDRPRV